MTAEVQPASSETSIGNPQIYQLEIKPKHTLSHEVGAGALCTKCDCTGLDLHFWRKRCKVCGCKMDDHEVVLPNDHGQIVIHRLFGGDQDAMERMYTSQQPRESISGLVYSVPVQHAGSLTNDKHVRNNEKSSPSCTAQYNVDLHLNDRAEQANSTYTWIPDMDKRLSMLYMESLPPEERPIQGTQGEANRNRRLTYQLPLFDFNLDRISDEKERETLNRFVNNVKKNVAGVGELVEVDQEVSLEDALKNLEISTNRNGAQIHASGRKTIHPTSCWLCRNGLNHGDIAVQTEHGRPGSSWHPACFRCCKCDQLLADLIYFHHKRAYYCGRHFAELQYPRCAGCDELIFAKEYTLAEEKPWHFDHFACYSCDLKLGGHRYITRDDQPHCLPCYMTRFAKTCRGCGKKIAAEEKRLNYGDLHWHAVESCFKCGSCNCSLMGRKFYLKDELLFCSTECKNKETRATSTTYSNIKT